MAPGAPADERLVVGRELTRRLLERHGDGIVAVGLHGSVARGEDADLQELQIAVITAADASVAERLLRYRGMVVDLGVIEADAYLEEARQIGPAWPLAASQYVDTLPLHDPGRFFDRLRTVHEEAVRDAPASAFLEAAGFDLVEALRREVKARGVSADPSERLLLVKEATLLAALVVGLLGRTRFHGEAHALRAAPSLPAAPPGFAGPFAVAATSADADAAVEALGQALDSAAAAAHHLGVQFEADNLEAFL